MISYTFTSYNTTNSEKLTQMGPPRIITIRQKMREKQTNEPKQIQFEAVSSFFHYL